VTSKALLNLLAGVDEVQALRSEFPVPKGIPSGYMALAAKAHGRSCVVLLSSHLDRYVYAVNEEAIDWINRAQCDIARFPDEFLLQHSKGAVDSIAARSWERRAESLREFIAVHGELWSPGGVSGSLNHAELLTWMRAPKPESLQRFYRLYGVENIFQAVTRGSATRAALYLGIRELVEKRNNIAHGDFETQALPTDVTRYLAAVQKFAVSADNRLSLAIRRLVGQGISPW
jgi:hypothetical protein